MTRNEFMRYLEFLKELFPNFKVPASKEALLEYYKPFERTTYDIAKRMAGIYLKNLNGPFKYAELLNLRTYASNGFEIEEKLDDCKSCKNTGVILIEILKDGKSYDCAYRCNCGYGSKLWSGIPKIADDLFLIRDKHISGVWKIRSEFR